MSDNDAQKFLELYILVSALLYIGLVAAIHLLRKKPIVHVHFKEEEIANSEVTPEGMNALQNVAIKRIHHNIELELERTRVNCLVKQLQDKKRDKATGQYVGGK